MNRILLSLCALMLSASAANAQYLTSPYQVSKHNMVTAKAGDIKLHKLVAPAQVSVAKKNLAPQKLNANQKTVGVSGSETMLGGVGLPGAGSKVKGIYSAMDASYLSKFKGAKIVGARYLLNGSLGSSAQVELYNINGESPVLYTSKAASSQKVSTLKSDQSGFDQQWNEVIFDKALDVNDVTTGVVVGYTYTQKTTKKNGEFTEECYPVAVGQGTDGILAYGNLGQDATKEGWFQVSSEYVACIQLIVEQDGGFPDDLAIVQLATNPMFKPNDALPFQFYVNNSGSKECSNAAFDILVDNNSVAELTLPSDAAIGDAYVKLSASIDLSELSLDNGAHVLGVKVKSVNGKAPSGDTSDDVAAAQFRVYTENTSRQYNLLEQFTSTSCVYCPWGYETLRALTKSRDDVAWVAIHGLQDKNNPDPYTISDADAILGYSTNGFPSANFNRFNLGGNMIATNIATEKNEQLAEQLSGVLDMEDEIAPSVVNLQMETNLTVGDNPNLKDATLNITIKGTGVKDASKILEGATLGLYVTENGVKSKQYSPNGWIGTYNHENVLRVIGTENPWGDVITWNGDNFEMTYEVTIPKKQYNYYENKNTLNAVAFVSLPFMINVDGKNYFNGDLNNVWVNQCQFLELPKGQATAIKGVETSENATVVARYAADGSEISAPVKGINILKLSDGTTRKVVVK